MLRTTLALAVLFAFSCIARVSAAEPGDGLLGKWWFPEKNGKMEISKDEKTGKYFGKVIAYDDPEALDEHNPDPELAKRKFVGITMLANFTYDADDKLWSGGTVYDGDSGKTYKCQMWLEEDDPNTLVVKGYIGLPAFGRKELFKRVTKEDEEKEAAEAAKKKEEKPAEEKKPE